MCAIKQFPVVNGGYGAKSNHREGFTAPQLGRCTPVWEAINAVQHGSTWVL